MIEVVCKLAMSVICKLKIPMQMTIFQQPQRPWNNINPVQNAIFVIWACLFIYIFSSALSASVPDEKYGGEYYKLMF